jgi:hypothetical protein
MREMQAYYKIKTKSLHLKIDELKDIVHSNHKNIMETRGQYTDELLSLKESVSDLRNMAS